MALPENWVDGAGQAVNATFLNQLGAEVNANTDALDGRKLRVMAHDDYDELESPDPNTVYLVF